jgi:hypothetical protein
VTQPVEWVKVDGHDSCCDATREGHDFKSCRYDDGRGKRDEGATHNGKGTT